jgi:hypothetical protein
MFRPSKTFLRASAGMFRASTTASTTWKSASVYREARGVTMLRPNEWTLRPSENSFGPSTKMFRRSGIAAARSANKPRPRTAVCKLMVAIRGFRIAAADDVVATGHVMVVAGESMVAVRNGMVWTER